MKKQSIVKSFGFAIHGIRQTFQREQNFRFHSLITIIVFVLSAFLQLNSVQFCILLLCIGSVLAMELMNTSIEYLVDLASPEYSELARSAKDASAGAVLAVSIMSVLIGSILLIPPLIDSCKRIMIE